MRNTEKRTVKESPWRRAKEAMEYFQIGRATLDKVSVEAGAKKKVGKVALYNIVVLDSYLNQIY